MWSGGRWATESGEEDRWREIPPQTVVGIALFLVVVDMGEDFK